MNPSELIFQACNLAVNAHEGQKRKSDNTPYIEHPIAVSHFLSQWGCDEKTISAGLLHDVIEDCNPMYKKEIKKLDKEIYTLVKYCSEEKFSDNQKVPWKIRKENTIKKIPNIPQPALCILLADKTHNLYSMYKSYLELKEKVFSHFNAPKEQQKWYYQLVFTQIKKRKNELPLKAQATLEWAEKMLSELFI